MDEKLKLKLVNALKGAGMSEGLADSMTGLSEEQVNVFIAGLPKPTAAPTIAEVIASPAFDQYLGQGGFDELLKTSKTAQSQFDKKVTKSLSTFKDNLLGKEQNTPPNGNPQPTAGGQGQGDGDAPAWAQALISRMDNLENGIQAGKTQNTIDAALKSSKLPANLHGHFGKLIDTNSETSVEDQIKALEKDFGGIKTEEPTTGQNQFQFKQGGNNGGRTEGEKSKLAEMAKSLK